MTAVAEPVPAVSPQTPETPEAPIWRLTVEQYHRMIDAAILTDGDPVELLEGWLVEKMTKYPSHTLARELVEEALGRLTRAGWFIRSQEPITTIDSEPEPDLFVVRGERRDYRRRHPRPDEVALVVEVADSSLRTDRTLKKRVYARAGIVSYWILNIVERQLEAHTDPTGPADKPDYRHRQVHKAGEEVPVVLDGEQVGSIAVSELLP